MAPEKKKRRRAITDTSDSDSDNAKTKSKPHKKNLNSDAAILKTLETLLANEQTQASTSNSKPLTLSDLSLSSTCREVADLPLSSVQSNIETLILSLARSILSGRGFSFSVPSRSAANQLYVPQLDRIVLKDKASLRPYAAVSTVRKTTITTRILQLIHQLSLKNIHVTKRDLFYTDVKLFQDQTQSDAVLDDVSCILGCTRSSLNVVAAEKGVVVGRLIFSDNGDMIDCTKMGMGGKAIPPNIDRVGDMQSDALFILLVEKDAAYMRLAEDRFYNRFPCIIVTAKGQPDVATRLFLRKMKMELKLPVLALVDSDPYGLKILSVYGCGSKNMSYDSANLTTPDIKWLGVRPSDLDKYKIPEQCRLPMTEQDIKTGKDLLEEDFVKKNPGWVEELTLMVKTKQKAEIQALSSFGFQYLSEVYLPLKLQQKDWL
ncbi:DNA topoisomerase 6 subunit A [Rhododendron vialii]|uniref:DNA topoisomerase 6 subunit A n=1 Tax=Rhododendron vialii TaxID=182163 RepID=UPI00265F96C7|nr:DNA topoisomerase 6 subunit A [Rhododendron vialii]